MFRRIARSDRSPSASHARGISRLSRAGINKRLARANPAFRPAKFPPGADKGGGGETRTENNRTVAFAKWHV